MDAVIDRAPDGTPIRVLDAIVASLIAGNYFETACALVGVRAEQAYAWLRTAGKLRIRASGRELEDLDLTHLDRLCLEFSDAVRQANATWEAVGLATLDRLAAGEISVTTTKTREVFDVKTGEVRQRIVTTTVREIPPSAMVLMWRLSRRFPQRYGSNPEPEPEVMLSDEEKAEALVDSVEAFLSKYDDDEPPD